MYITTAGWINYAIEKGYIPVIDMSVYRNNYLSKAKRGIDNAWEYYFNQPMGYGIKEAYKAKNLILSSMRFTDDRPDQSMDFFNNANNVISHWRQITDKYMRINAQLSAEMKAEYEQLLNEKERILGVLARGTDYNKLKPSKHPIMPSADQLIADSRSILEDYKCELIFLATEDTDILRAFEEEFGDKVITNDRNYIDYKKGYICQEHSAREDDEYLSGKEYLATIWMLSRSKCILCGRTSGAVATVLMADNEFEYSHFYDLGIYP